MILNLATDMLRFNQHLNVFIFEGGSSACDLNHSVKYYYIWDWHGEDTMMVSSLLIFRTNISRKSALPRVVEIYYSGPVFAQEICLKEQHCPMFN